MGVPVRREHIVAKPGKFNGDEVRDALMQQFGIGLFSLEEPGKPLVRV